MFCADPVEGPRELSVSCFLPLASVLESLLHLPHLELPWGGWLQKVEEEGLGDCVGVKGQSLAPDVYDTLV